MSAESPAASRRSIATKKPRGGPATLASRSIAASERSRFAAAISSRLYALILARMSDIVGYRDQAIEPALSFAGIDRMGGGMQPVFEVFRLARDHECRGGVEKRDVAERRGVALKHIQHRCGVGRRVAAAQCFGLDLSQAEFFRRNLESLHLAVFEGGDAGRPGRGNF